jgi:hypothetical protein
MTCVGWSARVPVSFRGGQQLAAAGGKGQTERLHQPARDSREKSFAATHREKEEEDVIQRKEEFTD